LAFLDQHRDQSGIIYCSTRQQVDELTAALNANGRPALPYHAGLDDTVRRQNQERFLRDDEPIMVATVAFGMGINKSNVRFVMHFNLPKDPESYYQEIGRAGRDGLPADCLLLHSRGDAMTIRHFIEQGAASERLGRQARLNALLHYAETPKCRRLPLLAYFGETLEQTCGHCDNCRRSPATTETTDVTTAAQKLLSCVQRTGQCFGPAHIIAVLRGSRSQKVLARGHDRLSTFGIGREYSAAQWRDLTREFIQLGLLEHDVEYGSLRLTPQAWNVLRGEKVHAALTRPAAPALPEPERPNHDGELFHQLRQLRKELADEAGVPAYVIFSDRALTEMATFFPQTEVEFLTINGVGQAKLANYGQAFLQRIRDYCLPRGLTSRPAPGRAPTALRVRSTAKRRYQEVGERFAAGQTVEAIQEQFDIQRETILQHLHRFRLAGGQLDPQRLLASSRLPEPDRVRALAAFEQLGLERLGPIHDALGGSIPYDELHLLRLYLLCGERGTTGPSRE
jgi:ATP-dependent DNA helicase RecQ